MRMRPMSRRQRRARGEDGFTMIFVVMVLFVGSLLVGGALAAATEDIHLTSVDTSQKKAYFAALAGIDTYKYQLNANPNYWLTCPGVNKVTVPGTTDESYTYKTLPSTGHAKCESGKQATIVEAASSASGTFRIQSTGVSGGKERSIVATFTHPGFLNYVWLTNYEVEDPATFEPQPKNCAHYYEERKAGGWLVECPGIDFIPEDKLNGPFHTNDAVSICGVGGTNPVFGRVSTDSIEMNQGHYKATDFASCQNTPNIIGKYTTEAPTLLPPESPDAELLEAAEYKFKGRTVIELQSGTPNTMVVTNNKGVKETKNFPTNGVVYVENETTCPFKYSPFGYDNNYTEDTVCGDVYIKGTYTESLTVAAQSDVIIIGNLTTETAAGKPTGSAALGLIADNFVRVYHPVKPCVTECVNNRKECNAEVQTAAEDPRGWGAITNPTIDAAILSTSHSWVVDNFTCGKNLGTLTVWGSIAQYWRGRVTAGSGGGGYVKSYNYDERLATLQPPSFLAPTTTSGWKISRETAPQNGCC
jgi:type II secretory pathway pseudopilin PulG